MSSSEAVRIGSIVKVRTRLWRVDDANDKTFEATSIDGSPQSKRKFFIPMEQITEGKLEPPDPNTIGNPAAQDLVIRAFMFSMIHGTAPLLSIQRSRVIPEVFQLVPVVMALEMTRVRMLIADDVGLGKTIEAGLIVTELLARNRAKRLLVICPASLREQWKQALSYFFHINAEIISSQHRRGMERKLPPGRDPWEYFPYLISSMDYAKDAEIKTQILEYDWDIVIIDEAHNLAKPHQINKNHEVEMERWELARDLAKRTTHLILLTATPHNGYTDTFGSLLKILDINAVSGPDYDPTINKEIARGYVCQRRRIDIEKEINKTGGEKNPFPKRITQEIVTDLSELEEQIMNIIGELGKHIINVAGNESIPTRRLAKWTVTHLHKRCLSSPRALRKSLENRLKKVLKLLNDQDLTGESALNIEEARAQVLDNDPGERTSEENASSKLETFVIGDRNELIREKEMLERAILIAGRLTPQKDSKLKNLLSNTLRLLINNENRHRVIIFTKYKDTMDYLSEQIPLNLFYNDVKVLTISGGLNETQREERFKEFGQSEKSILVATDAISEGLNLQYICSQIIHYELPWNPNRLEQRNGRIDRYGQPQKDVRINTLVANYPLEAAILQVLVKKADTIRRDYGFSPPFFGDENSMLDIIHHSGIDVQIGQTKLDIFCQDLSSKPQMNDPFSESIIKKMSEDNFFGQASIDLSEVERRLKNAEELIGNKEEIKGFIESGINKFGCKKRNNSDDTFTLEINDNRLLKNSVFPVIKKCTFDPLRGINEPELEVIDLGHPIVQNMISLVKEQAFLKGENYCRTACVCVNKVEKITVIYTFLARYVVRTNPVSIIEELAFVSRELLSNKVIDDEQLLDQIRKHPRLPIRRTIEEMRQDLSLGLSDNYDEILKSNANRRCNQLIAERKIIKQESKNQNKSSWIEGIDDLLVASVDLLCVTVYYPGRG